MLGFINKISRTSNSAKGLRNDLDSYRSIYRNFPKPSDMQIKDFIEFVCHSKSWYKHLPLLPPGVPFHFYFDQYAGWNRIQRLMRKVKFVEQKDDNPPLHYPGISTSQYQKQFGMLSFSCVRGTKMYGFYSGGRQDIYQQYPIVYSSDGKSHRIPEEVLNVSTIYLTSPIHFYTAKNCLGLLFDAYVTDYDFINLDERKWPEETGGDKTLKKLKQIKQIYLQKLDSDVVDSNFNSSIIEQLNKLIEPEQIRLRKKMFLTVKNLCDLVYE